MVGNLRLPFIVTEPLTGGYPNLRAPLITAQPVQGGYPNLRVPIVTAQPLQGGYPNLRMPIMVVQALFPVAEDLPVSTTPFPGFGNSVSNPAIPAAADPFNTALPGLSFSVHKKPTFKTKISESTNGNEFRSALMQYPRWDFELTYELLEDKSGAASSLKTIMGFFLSRQGSFDSWLFKDPDDYLVTNGFCGVADGVTTQFPLCRTMGDFHEKVGQVDTANTINVYVNGVLQAPASYTVTLPNLIVFSSAPVSGNVTADFQFYFACRFIDDQQDYEKFYDKLWNLQTCDFRSIIQ